MHIVKKETVYFSPNEMNAFAEVIRILEGVAFIASNTINFPTVYNGEEAWIEVTVKMPKETGDDGYMKREEYKMKCEESERKAKEKEEAKAKKIAKDNEKRKKKEEEKG